GPPNRADLLAWDGHSLIAVEAKGLEGSAREKNLRQSQQWLAEVRKTLSSSALERSSDHEMKAYADIIADMGVPLDSGAVEFECKGLMVIGTHRSTPLVSRTEPDFPDPLVRSIGRSEITAITGISLLALLVQVRNGLKTKDEALNDIVGRPGAVSIPLS